MGILVFQRYQNIFHQMALEILGIFHQISISTYFEILGLETLISKLELLEAKPIRDFDCKSFVSFGIEFYQNGHKLSFDGISCIVGSVIDFLV